jgi:hypothetical protein
MLGAGRELPKQLRVHAYGHHFAGALANRAAATLAKLLSWVSALGLVSPGLDHLRGDWCTIDPLSTHV